MGPDTVEVAAAVGRLTKVAFRVAATTDENAERVREILNRARREIEELT
jgi:hypothetical protein